MTTPRPGVDALVATRVMGWRWGRPKAPVLPQDDRDCWIGPRPASPGVPAGEWVVEYGEWSPSSDPAAAWEVVEKMRDRDPLIRPDGRLWVCIMDASADPGDTMTHWHDHRSYTIARRRVDEHADTMPMAVCICALRAVGVSEEEINAAL